MLEILLHIFTHHHDGTAGGPCGSCVGDWGAGTSGVNGLPGTAETRWETRWSDMWPL